ncbi:Spermidine synthase [Mycena kentingensis (nom. inval.)]|nr:Spermidine synthase [Mycena kentingensis (nom. inval.)]
MATLAHAITALSALASVSAVSLVLFAYTRSLTPIYGSAPTTYTLNASVFVASLTAALLPWRRSNLLAAVLLACAAPKATYWVAVWTARWDRPVAGPLATHLTTLVPLLSVLLVAKSSSLIQRALACAMCCAASIFLSSSWSRLDLLRRVSDTQIYILVAAASLNIWVATRLPQSAPPSTLKKKLTSHPKSRSRSYTKPLLLLTLNGILWSISSFFASPILPHPLLQRYLRPDFPLVIHSSVQSLTGLIVVGEALPPPNYKGGPDTEMHSLRYLRADHSLLGGVWVGGKVAAMDEAPFQRDSFGDPIGDSIYSTFVLHEAARLVNSTARKYERAAIIGLGVGISPIGFGRHGLSTTIVEIDPAVYDAARLYFGLPEHDAEHLFLEDARQWAARRHKNVDVETPFDIIVHDCFSGGGVPEHIFTLEFWNDLKASLHPEGVLVVNFAGTIVSESSRMISQTLFKAFGNCRAFNDAQKSVMESEYETLLMNIVFFCTPHSAPLTFRKARRSDYLDSYLREFILSGLENREVAFELLTGQLDDKMIIRDDHNLLGKLQNNLGHHHWQLMREILPAVFWETF